ncbi:hypothetical protein M569_08587, partial [Genlisea aurea]
DLRTLQPDITAPGVSILAAYTEDESPTNEDFDKRRAPFNVLSGTSMSCPHVAGVVGLLKTMYPHWSPAAIKSAIVTTARTRGNTLKPLTDASSGKATPFDYGGGHIYPNRAMDPGLVYDLSLNDYFGFLCSIGYTSSQLKLISGDPQHPYECLKNTSRTKDFNYPSIAVDLFGKKPQRSVRAIRRVKNVGSVGTYRAYVRNPDGVSVSVQPRVLRFEAVGEEKEFEVTIAANGNVAKGGGGRYAFGELRWSDGRRKHHVRSQIVV